MNTICERTGQECLMLGDLAQAANDNALPGMPLGEVKSAMEEAGNRAQSLCAESICGVIRLSALLTFEQLAASARVRDVLHQKNAANVEKNRKESNG